MKQNTLSDSNNIDNAPREVDIPEFPALAYIPISTHIVTQNDFNNNIDPLSNKISSLSDDVQDTLSDIQELRDSKVSITRKINGYELSSEVDLTASDIKMQVPGNTTVKLAVENRLDSSFVENKFKSNVAYTTGQRVVYDSKVYEFIQDKAAGNWNANVVKEIQLSSYLDSKVDKIKTPTAGDFAQFDANGNLVDNGTKTSDFVLVSSNPVRIGSGASIASTSNGSVAIGNSAQINGNCDNSIAIGNGSRVTKPSSGAGSGQIAIGSSAKVQGIGSAQLGHSLNTLSDDYTLRFRDTIVVKNGQIPAATLTPEFDPSGRLSSYYLGSQTDKHLQVAGYYNTEDAPWVPLSGNVNVTGDLTVISSDLIHSETRTATFKNILYSNDIENYYSGDVAVSFDSRFIEDLTHICDEKIPITITGVLKSSGETEVTKAFLISPFKNPYFPDRIQWQIVDESEVNIGTLSFSSNNGNIVANSGTIHGDFMMEGEFQADSTSEITDSRKYIYDDDSYASKTELRVLENQVENQVKSLSSNVKNLSDEVDTLPYLKTTVPESFSRIINITAESKRVYGLTLHGNNHEISVDFQPLSSNQIFECIIDVDSRNAENDVEISFSEANFKIKTGESVIIETGKLCRFYITETNFIIDAQPVLLIERKDLLS